MNNRLRKHTREGIK